MKTYHRSTDPEWLLLVYRWMLSQWQIQGKLIRIPFAHITCLLQPKSVYKAKSVKIISQSILLTQHAAIKNTSLLQSHLKLLQLHTHLSCH